MTKNTQGASMVHILIRLQALLREALLSRAVTAVGAMVAVMAQTVVIPPVLRAATRQADIMVKVMVGISLELNRRMIRDTTATVNL